MKSHKTTNYLGPSPKFANSPEYNKQDLHRKPAKKDYSRSVNYIFTVKSSTKEFLETSKEWKLLSSYSRKYEFNNSWIIILYSRTLDPFVWHFWWNDDEVSGGGVRGLKKKTMQSFFFCFYEIVASNCDKNFERLPGETTTTVESLRFSSFAALVALDFSFRNVRLLASFLVEMTRGGGKYRNPRVTHQQKTRRSTFTSRSQFSKVEKKKKLLTLSQTGTRVIFCWAIRKVGIRH